MTDMSDTPDTHAASIVTDHPFEPRTKEVDGKWLHSALPPYPLPPNPFLCAVCRLAQAAHLEVAVPYVSDAPRAKGTT